MKQELTLYHGSQQIVEMPKYGVGKTYNDYGLGFYCTEYKELAKEWACPVKKDGYANQYILQLDGLKVMHLTKGKFHILNWLAILLANRTFDIASPIAKNAREYILTHFLPDLYGIDVVIGYRADDSYFSFAEDFLNNSLSLDDLGVAMKLGELGEQVVLVSERAFSQISFCGYEIADYREYYFKRMQRDKRAREAYATRTKGIDEMKKDLYIYHILMEEMTDEDIRLQSVLFE